MGFFILAVVLILLFQWTSSGTKAIPASDAHAPAASVAPPSCLSADCPTGTQAITNATQQDPFYLCKTDGLSEYANFVLNVMIKQDRYAEIVPSVKTGELALQGDEKLLLDKYRAKAGAASFEDALSKCYRGLAGEKVVVLYSPTDSSSIYVADAEVPENKFWLPKARLFRQ